MHKNAEDAKNWNIDQISEDYVMESNSFDYEEIMKRETFGIKKYQDSVYRGELTDSN